VEGNVRYVRLCQRLSNCDQANVSRLARMYLDIVQTHVLMIRIEY